MPSQPIIDFHGHTGRAHNTHYEPGEISRYLATQPVERVLVSSLSAVFSRREAEAELLALAADPKVVPLYWVNPYRGGWAHHLARLHERLPIRGIKLHPTADIYEPEPGFLRPVWEHCRAQRRFLCVHTDTFRSSPDRLTSLILDYPDVDVVLIHMDDPIQSLFLAMRCPNVYLETSWVERKWENLAPLKIALRAVSLEQILFGTDFPYEFPLPSHVHRIGRERTYADIAEHYRELLPPAAAPAILYDNAKAFLARYGG